MTGFDKDQPRDDRGEWTSNGSLLSTKAGDVVRHRQHAMNPTSVVYREHVPDPVIAVSSQGARGKTGEVIVLNPGDRWSQGSGKAKAAKRKKKEEAPVTILNKDAVELHDVGSVELVDAGKRRTSDGYVAAWAKVARVGTQKYRGSEVGRPTMDHAVLYRPPEEVFSADAMRSMANKPVTLTHPRRMVDAASWSKHAKGFSGTDVVRDGDFVRVPLMLTDADAIRAFEHEGIKEMSVGYLCDIDWTAGTTPDGEKYDGVQRNIRANHHALVPVARGGKSLTFGDGQGRCPICGGELDEEGNCPNCDDGDGDVYDAAFTTETRRELAKKGEAKPDGSYPIRNAVDLDHAIRAWGRGGATASDKAWIISRARTLGNTSMLPEAWGAKDHGKGDETMVRLLVDGVNIEVADETQAAYLKKFIDGIQLKLKDADDDDADDEAARQKKERGYQDAIAAKDGEIAALKKQLGDSQVTDAILDARIAERAAVVDAAKPLLPKDFVVAGKSLADIRRSAVAAQMGDAAVKDMNDAAIVGAFQAYTASTKRPNGVRLMADGMTDALRGGHTNQVATNDAGTAYEEMVQRNADAWKKPIQTSAR